MVYKIGGVLKNESNVKPAFYKVKVSTTTTTTTTLYDILGIGNTASPSEIKKAYRQKSFQFHPDRNKDPLAHSTFQSIQEAYETLHDVVKRQQYDLSLTTTTARAPATEMDNFLVHMLRGGGEGRPLSRMNTIFSPLPSEESMFSKNGVFAFDSFLVISVHLSLEESYSGCVLPVEIERNIISAYRTTQEKETVYVDFPPGIDTNEYIILSQKGHIYGKEKGDVKLIISLLPHTTFQRNGFVLSSHYIVKRCFVRNYSKFRTPQWQKISNIYGNRYHFSWNA